ncbi:DUF3152 domain-containing protein [Streptomyces spinoverrucosus]|uniref:DUF3152 domain-containing protein n=1 Tax=Streptomyces spinoverrucosus TaxID=284043 RepID=UPI0018C3AD45|nr:DUF3152 domain-containing protein [Streptomyces spinoverrucosus]MBG0852657.1 DUF3152 domain-containing protein [Streptomyces spinoverrucosus]
MGRHSRRGPAPKGDTADKGTRRRAPGPSGRRGVAEETPARGVPRAPDGTPGREAPRFADGAPGREAPRFADGAPGQGVPRFADGAPGQGVTRFPGGTTAPGAQRLPDGTPAHGFPRLPDGTPAHGMPRFPDGTPAHGVPQVRGGHPEQREQGGGWGELRGRTVAGTGAPVFPRQRQAPPGQRQAPPGQRQAPPGQRQAPPGPRQARPGPRQDYLDAFDEQDDVFVLRNPALTAPTAHSYASVTSWDTETEADDEVPPTGEPASPKGGKGRALAGIAAAAVTTVLAVIVAGQVTGQGEDGAVESQSAGDQSRDVRDSASRGDGRPTPSGTPSAAPLTYEQKMGRTYPLSATLDGSGKFDAIPGIDKAPGAGQKYTYRVDVEQGLGLDGELFAQAVQKTLNDDRSWAHSGGRTFERIHSGKPDFVITLASPGTTADWCAKSGLDTTVDNVSCDSAATERVMINAYRWAQGSETYGDKIYAYRQMLINHEIGHRLGYSHVTCDKAGELAPVMQQQTKFLEHDGIRCKANPWPYPES